MMKKYAIIFAVTLLAFSFTACQGKGSNEPTTEKENISTEGTMEHKEDSEDNEEATTKEDITTEEPTEAIEEKTEEEKSLFLTLYTPNENVDGLIETDIEVSELNEFVILNELIEANVLKEGTAINGFEKTTEEGKGYLILDFNEKLGELLNSYGSSGEYVTMASIANTFLKAYDADFFKFTINGEIFESGHIIYDEPIGFSGF
jgi:hypothetical protein